eukprot:scaffold34585_cov221-Amphora_coffeaeformis.AAC.4
MNEPINRQGEVDKRPLRRVFWKYCMKRQKSESHAVTNHYPHSSRLCLIIPKRSSFSRIATNDICHYDESNQFDRTRPRRVNSGERRQHRLSFRLDHGIHGTFVKACFDYSRNAAKKVQEMSGGPVDANTMASNITKILVCLINNAQRQTHHEETRDMHEETRDMDPDCTDHLKSAYIKANNDLIRYWGRATWVSLGTCVGFGLYSRSENGSRGLVTIVLEVCHGVQRVVIGECPSDTAVSSSYIGSILSFVSVQLADTATGMSRCGYFYGQNLAKSAVVAGFVHITCGRFIGVESLQRFAVGGSILAWLAVSEIKWSMWYFGAVVSAALVACLYLREVFKRVEKELLSQAPASKTDVYAKKLELQKVVDGSIIMAVMYVVAHLLFVFLQALN